LLSALISLLHAQYEPEIIRSREILISPAEVLRSFSANSKSARNKICIAAPAQNEPLAMSVNGLGNHNG
jgi:hypothetical protein